MSKFAQAQRRGSVRGWHAQLPQVWLIQSDGYPAAYFFLSWEYPLPAGQTVTAYLQAWDGAQWWQVTAGNAGTDDVVCGLDAGAAVAIGTPVRCFYGFEGAPYSGNGYTSAMLLT